MVYLLTGSGGSGKSNLLLNSFKDKNMYKKQFDNIYYFCPSASFNSIKDHPFEKHNKVYHELDVPTLSEIYNELVDIKDVATKEKEEKPMNQYTDVDEVEEESDEEQEIQYSAIIIDDFANDLKNIDIQKYLNKMIIKARHICCSFFITLQSYGYMPKILRKQVTYITIFKPKNKAEFESIADEVLNMNKQDALTLYNFCFDKPYCHIDIDTTTNKLYKNFDLLKIKSS
jgi:hypothetical protein